MADGNQWPRKKTTVSKAQSLFWHNSGSCHRVHGPSHTSVVSVIQVRLSIPRWGSEIPSQGSTAFFPRYVTPPRCGGGTQQGSHQHLAQKLCGHLEVAVFGHDLPHTHMWAVPSSHFPLSEPPLLYLSSALAGRGISKGACSFTAGWFQFEPRTAQTEGKAIPFTSLVLRRLWTITWARNKCLLCLNQNLLDSLVTELSLYQRRLWSWPRDSFSVPLGREKRFLWYHPGFLAFPN